MEDLAPMSTAWFPNRGRRCQTSLVLLLILAILSSQVACQRPNARAAAASRTLARQLVDGSIEDPNHQDPPAGRIEEQRVYLDATYSMSGYVNPANHSTFDDFIDEIGNAMPGCQLFRYGQQGNTPARNVSELTRRVGFGLELHRPGFYNQSYNPDDRLIDFLAGENRPVLSVLISDGVYSEVGGSTPPPVVEAIKKWMERGGTFGILVLKSKFHGPFYSERARRMLPSLSVEARPFYAFVFSPTEQAFRDLREKLQARFPRLTTILFSDSAVTSTLVMPDRVGLYSHLKPPNAPYYWHMFDSRFFQSKDPALDYHLKYLPSPDYPAAEIGAIVQREHYRWGGGRFQAANGLASDADCQVIPVEPSQRTGEDPGTREFIIHTVIAMDPTSDFSLYHLKVLTTFKSLRQDIKDLSTRDDSVRENSSKTFRFFELVNALTEVHFQARISPRVSPPLFVTVANH